MAITINYAQNVGLMKRPPEIEVQGVTYRYIEVNGLLWITEELKNTISGVDVVLNNTHYYPKNNLSAVNAILPTGWRVATETDFTNLNNYYSGNKQKLCDNTGWSGLGTNESGLSFKQLGCTSSGYSLSYAEKNIHMVNNYNDRCFVLEVSGNQISGSFYTVASGYYTVRICKNA